MKISLIGLGIIGKAWTTHYQKRGDELKTWNRTPKEDCLGFEKDLVKAVEGAEVVHIVVADPPAVRGVLETIAPQLKGKLIIQSSTISPNTSIGFEQLVENEGGRYVEAPFTGSKTAAEAAQNVFYLGGDPAAKKEAIQVLDCLAKSCFDVGTAVQSSALKLAMNLQIASISQCLTEGINMVRHFGIDDSVFFEVIEQNVAKSGLVDLKKPKLLARDYSPQFSIKHMHKDISLALGEMPEGALPLTQRTREIYQKGLDAGLGEDDFIALIRLLEDSVKAET